MNAMEDLHIEPQKKTLDIQCTDDNISMYGNSLLPNSRTFFQPVFDWVTEYVKNPSKKTEVSLKFEYIDTASIQALFDVLKLLKSIPDNEERVIVNWYFEFDDPELLEIGEIMEGRLKLNFNFIDYTA